jgi:F-type H+-transporting ATPase subunit c
MDPAAAKLIGAGLAAIGTGAAAIGVGNLIFGFAVTEALGIFSLLIALLLLFAL